MRRFQMYKNSFCKTLLSITKYSTIVTQKGFLRGSARTVAGKTSNQHITMRDFQNKVFGIELADGPVYLRVVYEDGASSATKAPPTYVTSLFYTKDLYYVTGFIDKVSFAENVSRQESLKLSLLGNLTEKIEVIPGVAYSASEYYEKGHFVSVNHNGSHRTEEHLLSLADKLGNGEVLKITLSDNGEKKLKIKCLVGANSREIEEKDYDLIPTSLPKVHPAFMSPGTSSVYHDIQRAYNVLNESEYFAEIDELRSICDQCIKEDGDDFLTKLPLRGNHPVIVIEGLDATGKTTLTRSLGKVLNATVLKSPPECICHLRSKFDSKTQLIRRAFYTLSNYAFAAMIKKAAKSGVVIADRFWNSTAAYAIATDVGSGGAECLPPVGHWVYSWPSDLLAPDAVFLLTITDEERRRRLLHRGTIKTDEEIRLERSSPFRVRLEESYKRMDNPPMQLLDASGTEKEVLNKTLEILKSGGYI